MASKLGLVLGPAVLGVTVEALAGMPAASAAEIAVPPQLPQTLGAQFGPAAAGSGVATQSGVIGGSVVLFALVLALSSSGGGSVMASQGITPNVNDAVVVATPTPSPVVTAPLPTPVPVSPETATPSAQATSSSSTTSPQPSRPTPGQEPSVKPAPRPVIGIAEIDSGPGNVCYPTLRGTARANSTLTVTNGSGPQVQVQADATGQWQAGPLTGIPAGSRDVRIVDQDGAQTTAVGHVELAAPPILDVSRSATQVIIGVSGVPGRDVVVLVDGVALLTMTLDATGRASSYQSIPVAENGHEISVGYFAQCLTPQNLIRFGS